MAKYKISSSATTATEGKGTLENPFKITPIYAQGGDEVQVIDLHNCAVSLSGYGIGYNIEEIANGINTIENGDHTFYSATHLETYNCDMPNLTCATYMFSGCSNLTTFKSKMPSLVDTLASDMFGRCPLDNCELIVNESWETVLPSTLGLYYQGKADAWDSVTPQSGGLIKLVWSRQTT